MANNLADKVIDTPEQMLPSGNDLIDATQNAIIDAAENVSEVFESAEKVIQNTKETLPFYADVEFWVGMAFILVIIVLAKPGLRLIRAALQKRIAAVVSEIDEAIKLRDDAQQLLANYERKFTDTDKEVQSILEQSRKNIENMRREETAKLRAELSAKEKEVKRRIAASIEKVRQEINLSASRLSVDLAQRAILNYLEKSSKSQLIDEAIHDLDKLIKTS